ncbi:nicotinate (nicotinamide) nucleotide adenylyltransferase [Paenibacillus odorifer]|uniref:Probable nicotinate-nucleotide adenylyltransferase n=3 Tax=Paenibacillus odorifer TaxID=189426 RepID=A0A1R0YY88_9BACL|nr:nicotinate-nucleotide adenylyltransferase [Paenibacillus odorifer]AWV32474.1 nicotinic acid mononucleotide adenylyltransferase [Paenibacillus odorifer]OMD82324.1 nicotinate (nicotinamide) nucleotide adenylyltransferase [Paenibacillus odorifer]OME00671.1 nicotinate (nicotinamide) nucleotide adenylyltransferase [Paenibacillus odorifer]OME12733.1 nicotinate (nicotinamide) nucleotide adenylyltransferase [Paenibacillus odorifer]OME13114.1 nicotinate (nicotinamide) nucleotide adenylyltransferase 
MKVGIMGGTFDPLHIGHMMAAEAARDTYGLQEVWFMPSHIPPHKHEAGVSGEDRLAMVQEAVKNHEAFCTLDWEVVRGGVSYTYETIRRLQEEYPHFDLYFIIGADMVQYLPKWNEIEELVQRLTFIGVGRPGTPLDLDALPDFIAKKVLLADMPLVDISSTMLRERAAAGKSIRYMVPEAVFDYVQRSGLYGIQPRSAD